MYAWNQINQHYTNFDVYDNTNDQVYKSGSSSSLPVYRQAVADVRGEGIERGDGTFISAHYWNGVGKVATGGTWLRSSAGLSGIKQELLPAGSQVVVLSSGTVYRDGYYWWFVKKGSVDFSGTITTGWVAGDNVLYNGNSIDNRGVSGGAGFRGEMTQYGTLYWANQGYDHDWMFHYFYDNGPDIGVSHTVLSFPVSVPNPAVTLTLNVHSGNASGPLLSGVQVTGQDANGTAFSQTSNASGYVTLTGAPGTWQFTASMAGYQTNTWSEAITATETLNAFLTPNSLVDNAQLISESVPVGTQETAGTAFTEVVTMKNTGTTTWSAGASGYRLNLIGQDYLGAVPSSTNPLLTYYHPYATINGGSSVAPGGTAAFTIYMIAPETTGSFSDAFQMSNASGGSVGPQMNVQISVAQAGPIGQYDRAKAVSYANNYAGYVCSDGEFWSGTSSPTYYGAGTAVPTGGLGDDCAHFVSSCIGSEPNQGGGGLAITTRVPPAYGEPGAQRLEALLESSYAVDEGSIANLSPGDVIEYDWATGGSHVVLYLGNGEIAAHSTSYLDVSATIYPSATVHYVHILDAASNQAPNTPINSSPASGAGNQSVTPTLIASVFSDPNAGDTQAAAEWIVTRVSDGATMTDTGTDTTHLTAWTLPSGPLANSTAYSWKVRYEDNHGAWSAYSTVTTFTTMAASLPAVSIVATHCRERPSIMRTMPWDPS